MDLRWRLVVVLGAGSGLGAEVAERLARMGAGVLAVDTELDAARATADLVAERRARAWALSADVSRPEDRRVLAARSRDLGGADALVNPVGEWEAVEADFRAGLPYRRGRRDDAAIVDVVGAGWVEKPRWRAYVPLARQTTLVYPGGDDAGAARDVIELLSRGRDGDLRAP